MKQLTIIIRSDHHKLTFKKEIKKSLADYMKSGDKTLKSKLQILLSFERYGEEVETACASALNNNDFFRVTSHDQLKEEVKGLFCVMIYQGDVIRMDKLSIFVNELENNESSAYAITEDKALLTTNSKIPIWHSTFVEPYTPWINPRGLTLKRTMIDSFEELMRTDVYATGAITRSIMESRGYGELCYRPFEINSDQISSNDYTIQEGMMDDMIAFSQKHFCCLEGYIQSVMIALFRKQIESRGAKPPVVKYVKFIDDENIVAQRLSLHDKLYLLEMKYGRPILEECRITDNQQVWFKELQLTRIDRMIFRVDITEVRQKTIVFMGRTNVHLLGERCHYSIITDTNERFPLQMSHFEPFERKGLESESYNSLMQFTVEVPLRDGMNVGFFLEDDFGRRLLMKPKLGKFSRMMNNVSMSYFNTKDYIVRFENSLFWINRYTGAMHRKSERHYLRELIRKKRYTVIAYRILYFLDRIFQRKPVWLVADRPHISNDNGEHMFRYLLGSEAAKKNDIYFVLKKDSPDYSRMKRIGRVLKYGSLRHKIKHLESEFIICSAFNDLMTNAFGKSGPYYRDLRNFNFVYLRHGVSHNDQSAWLNKYRTNIRILISTCRPEYEGILTGSYAYTEREVRLTGLPRFDNLYDERQKKIAILPTWRKQLQGEIENRSSQRAYVSRFKDSDYFIFYDSLIHNERLLKVMEEYGYTGVFYLHPVFEAQYLDFSDSRRISIGKGVADYQTIFRESSIMVTDFSSVAFDFAYLKKPLIYSQFDEDTFYKNHSWGKGYFTYREDGFGPITKTVDETVDELIYYIENDCQMKPEYIEKVNRFFAYTDRNNCERVYNAICEVASRI